MTTAPPVAGARLLTPGELARARVLLRRARLTPSALGLLLDVPVDVIHRTFRGEVLPVLCTSTDKRPTDPHDEDEDEDGDVIVLDEYPPGIRCGDLSRGLVAPGHPRRAGVGTW